MDLLDSLNQDHELILQILPLYQKIASQLDQGGAIPKNIPALLDFSAQFILGLHHHLEENFLFQALKDNPKIFQGGPRCGFYMQLRLEKGTPSTSRQTLVVPASHPLSIPLEEHETGHFLIEEMKHALSTGAAQTLGRKIEAYATLIRQHAQKETECLFLISKDALTAEQLQTLEQQSQPARQAFASGVAPHLLARLQELSLEMACTIPEVFYKCCLGESLESPSK